jgi:iron complex transport system substrate-binding protein
MKGHYEEKFYHEPHESPRTCSAIFFFGSCRTKGTQFVWFVVKIFIPLLFISFTFLSMGCSRNSARFIVEEQGEVRRIISAAPSNTEIIVGLGMGDRLIAVDKYSGRIAGVPGGLPEIDFFFPDTEAIIGLEPDLIFVNEINSFGVANNPFRLLGDLGIRVVQVPTSVSIEGIYSDIILVAEVLGVIERGQALVSCMAAEIARIAAGAGLQRSSVYFEISSSPTLVTFGQGAYLNEMIEIAGGRNIFAAERGWFSPSAEEIINRNPDIIFTLLYPGEDPVSEIKNRRAFQSITAVNEGRVFAIDADSASRPSQNILLAFQQIAQVLNQ